MSAVNGDTGLTRIRALRLKLPQWVTVDGALQDQRTLAAQSSFPEKNPAVFFASSSASFRSAACCARPAPYRKSQ